MQALAPWAQILVMVLCTVAASYVGSLLAVTRLEEKYKAMHDDLTTEVKPRIAELGKRTHSQQAGLLYLDGRMMVVEDRLAIRVRVRKQTLEDES